MASRRAELPGHFDQRHTVLIGGETYKSKVGLNLCRPNVGSAFIINQKLASYGVERGAGSKLHRGCGVVPKCLRSVD